MNKARKLPYFQFYADDYLSSPGVTTCDLVDEGIYIRLLAYSWKHQGCQLPYDMKYLRRLCKGARAERIAAVIERHFEVLEVSKDIVVIRNSRLYTEFCKAMEIGSKRSQVSKSRWDKEKQDAIASDLHMQTGMQNDAIPDIRYQIPEKHRAVFVAPTTEEVKTYTLSRPVQIDPVAFVDFYDSKGWMIGKNKMRDWKAAVRTWERSRVSTPSAAVGVKSDWRSGK